MLRATPELPGTTTPALPATLAPLRTTTELLGTTTDTLRATTEPLGLAIQSLGLTADTLCVARERPRAILSRFRFRQTAPGRSDYGRRAGRRLSPSPGSAGFSTALVGRTTPLPAARKSAHARRFRSPFLLPGPPLLRKSRGCGRLSRRKFFQKDGAPANRWPGVFARLFPSFRASQLRSGI